MELWKPIVAIVPAGLLLGIAAGTASRPEMVVRDERPWPQSVRDNAIEVEPWRPIYESRPRDLAPGAYSYRPDLDYDVFAWPDQGDRPVDLVSAEFDREPDMPLTRRAAAELAASHALRVAEGAAAVATADLVATDGATTAAAPAVPPARRETIVLPPVPPPLATANGAPLPAPPDVPGAIEQ